MKGAPRGMVVLALGLLGGCMTPSAPLPPPPSTEADVEVSAEDEASNVENTEQEEISVEEGTTARSSGMGRGMGRPWDRPVVSSAPTPWDLSVLDRPGAWAQATLQGMSLREKAAQLIMPWVMGDFAPVGSSGYDRVLRLVEEEGVGGIIMSVGTPMEVAMKLNHLQGRARVPLLVAADLETGAGFRFRGAVQLPGGQDLGGATDFPSLMALGATDDPGLAYEMGRVTALEARALGVHVPFAPVLDVNNNPDNPIINTRSFGEDPERVAVLGAAFVRGIQDHGALATGKHFPGHGDTETDSHLELPVIRVDRARMERVELAPFRAALEAGMGGIMTAHVSVPQLTGGDGLPATLASPVLTGLLRQELGFRGIIFTDAMDMSAVDRRFPRGEATVRAVEAGADVILMPPDVPAALNALVGAVGSGRISEERLDRSVLRVLALKESMGLHREARVDPDRVLAQVGIQDHLDLSQRIAEESMTLLKNERNLLPLLGTRTARVLSVTYRRDNDLLAGRWFNATLRGSYPRLQAEEVGRSSDPAVYGQLLQDARNSNLVVVSVHVAAVAYSGDVAVTEELSGFIQELVRSRIPHVVISFGNPYLLREFPEAQAYLLAWSGSESSQRASARSLVGAIPIRGRTPTRIPPGFPIGHGIQLGARE